MREGDQKDAANQVLRTEALNDISQKQSWILVTYPEAIAERVIPQQDLSKETLHLAVGEKLDSDFVISLLVEYGFERVDFVYEPGQFAVRGSIIDVFSFSHDVPFRIDFLEILLILFVPLILKVNCQSKRKRISQSYQIA